MMDSFIHNLQKEIFFLAYFIVMIEESSSKRITGTDFENLLCAFCISFERQCCLAGELYLSLLASFFFYNVNGGGQN